MQPGFTAADDHPMKRPQQHFGLAVIGGLCAGETVCDPMMGGGTTGIAAANLNRPFVGIEIHDRVSTSPAAASSRPRAKAT